MSGGQASNLQVGETLIAYRYILGDFKMSNYIGVDVSKFHLDICNGHQVIRIPNTLFALKKWSKLLKKDTPTLVVCEATGGYERLLAQTLEQAAIPFLIEQPNKIRAFSRTKGLRAKTDQADAQLIFHYASTINPTAKSYSLSAQALEIRELLKRRDELIEDKNRESARLDKLHSPTIKRSIQSHLTHLDQQIKGIQEKIDQSATQPTIEKQVTLLTSIPGIGQQTALMILTHLPEIQGLPSKSLAALVGVAPFNRDSGKYQGKRFIQGGRKTLRKALYMAAVAAIRWNKPLGEFYQRLRNKGKPAKVVLVAIMNKIIAITCSVYKRQSPWVENLATSA